MKSLNFGKLYIESIYHGIYKNVCEQYKDDYEVFCTCCPSNMDCYSNIKLYQGTWRKLSSLRNTNEHWHSSSMEEKMVQLTSILYKNDYQGMKYKS